MKLKDILSKKIITTFFCSIKLTIFLLSAIIILSIIGTVIPQQQNPQAYIEHYGRFSYFLLRNLGILDIYHSWIFLTLLFLFSINLICCFSSRPILKRKFLGFTLTHLGFIIILLGAIIGSIWGEKGYIQIYEGKSVDSFNNRRNQPVKLGFTLELEDFILEHYDDSYGKLMVSLTDKNIEKELAVKLNQKYKIENSPYELEVTKYLPDFAINTQTKEVFSWTTQPNNPAILVEITNYDEGKIEPRWVFARFADMHFHSQNQNVKLTYQYNQPRIKDFKSKLNILEDNKLILSKTIEVNHPLTYQGYRFYQSSYDNEQGQWSGLQVAKDPGVAVVYTGFGLIIFGLMLNFYFKMGKLKK